MPLWGTESVQALNINKASEYFHLTEEKLDQAWLKVDPNYGNLSLTSSAVTEDFNLENDLTKGYLIRKSKVNSKKLENFDIKLVTIIDNQIQIEHTFNLAKVITPQIANQNKALTMALLTQQAETIEIDSERVFLVKYKQFLPQVEDKDAVNKLNLALGKVLAKPTESANFELEFESSEKAQDKPKVISKLSLSLAKE